MDTFESRYQDESGMYCIFFIYVLMCTAYTNLANTFLISFLVVVSEFSVAWGKRGGGQGREGVQLPDSLMYEAVLQSAGPRLETPQSPP